MFFIWFIGVVVGRDGSDIVLCKLFNFLFFDYINIVNFVFIH